MSLENTNTQNLSSFTNGVNNSQSPSPFRAGVNTWDRLRHASRTAPAVIAENMFSQIVELQNDIASREEGKRYPTMQEAELTRKLCLSIDRMKSAPALSQTMQVLRLFRSFANSYGDRDFRLTLNHVIEHFLEGNAKDSYMPYQIEYGTNEPKEINNPKDWPLEPTEAVQPEMKESFSPAKERQDNEKRSLFIVQSGTNSAHESQTAQTKVAPIANETQPETSAHETPPSPSERARGEVFSVSTPTSGGATDPQKPDLSAVAEVKRKFSHSMLNRIASSRT